MAPLLQTLAPDARWLLAVFESHEARLACTVISFAVLVNHLLPPSAAPPALLHFSARHFFPFDLKREKVSDGSKGAL
mgnify:CR=1 FL=1